MTENEKNTGASPNLEEARDEYRKKYKDYDKWAKYPYRWWKNKPKPRIQDFSGTGKNFKWPVLKPTGRMTVPMMDKDDRIKIINNVWRNTLFMQWLVMHETVGEEKAAEMFGYMWLAMTGAMEGLNERYHPDQPRDCVMLSKQNQIDIQYEMIDLDIVEEQPNRHVYRALCTYWADWEHRWKEKGLDIRKGLCDLGCDLWCKEWAHKINPKMTCRRTAWLVEGDPYCEFTYELNE